MNTLHRLERLELHCSVDDGEQGIVSAHHDALAGFEVLAALTHDDVAWPNDLTIIELDAEVLWVAVPPVT